MADDGLTTFDVVCEMQATSVGKMRTEVDARMVVGPLDAPMYEHRFEMASDEGSFHGGADSAPPPLAFFCTGLVTCLMTQIRAFAKRLRVPVGNVSVSANIKWEGRQKGRAPYTAHPIHFRLDIDLDTDASLEDQRRVIEAAELGCFVEATLADPVPVEHRLKRNDGWVDA